MQLYMRCVVIPVTIKNKFIGINKIVIIVIGIENIKTVDH